MTGSSLLLVTMPTIVFVERERKKKLQVGVCPFNGNEDTAQILLRAARSNVSSFYIPQPTCVPTEYSPLVLVYSVSENEIRTSTLHGMKALACGCGS